MVKSLLFRVFGIGRIPKELAVMMQSEGVLLMDEGIRGSTTYRSTKGLGKYFRSGGGWIPPRKSAAIVLTELRLLALMNSIPVINLPFADERIRLLQFSMEGPDRLCISFDPALFHDPQSHIVEHRFREHETSFLFCGNEFQVFASCLSGCSEYRRRCESGTTP
jgi:hypothetical protein